MSQALSPQEVEALQARRRRLPNSIHISAIRAAEPPDAVCATATLKLGLGDPHERAAFEAALEALERAAPANPTSGPLADLRPSPAQLEAAARVLLERAQRLDATKPGYPAEAADLDLVAGFLRRLRATGPL